MELIVFELGLTGDFGNTQLRQLIRPDRDIHVEALRPHLYVQNNPAGSVFMEIQDINGRTIVASNTVAISSFAATNTYFHGFVKFDLSIGLRMDSSYNIALKSTGYTYTSTDFVGWCNYFDDPVQLNRSTVPSPAGYSSPLDVEIWERKQILKEKR